MNVLIESVLSVSVRLTNQDKEGLSVSIQDASPPFFRERQGPTVTPDAFARWARVKRVGIAVVPLTMEIVGPKGGQ